MAPAAASASAARTRATSEPYAHLHLEGVGWGGRDRHDGNDAQFVKNGNCAEHSGRGRRDALPVPEHGVPDGAERGRRTAGTAAGSARRRVFRFLTDGVNIASHTNRHRVKAWGLDGGEDGTNTVIALPPQGRDRVGAGARGFRRRLLRQVLGHRR